MSPIVEIHDLKKVYDGDFEALKGVTLDIVEGEILALLGPNGAGKTTLISTICGISSPSSGTIRVGGHDVVTEYRQARRLVGLVPQEINIEPFSKVADTVAFTRGLFGKKRDDALVEKILRDLSLWEKRDSRIHALSGGMKRRVLIAKALAHEPRVLFLDEPTAGVDVELRRDMWELVEKLRAGGVTIILTTHYIEEAEAIADRVGVINNGALLLVEDKTALMQRMGKKVLRIELRDAVTTLPDCLDGFDLAIAEDGRVLTYTYDTHGERTGITRLLGELQNAGVALNDIQTSQSTLEDIFVDIVKDTP
ncbi:MAG: ABC transporter ATP-binding protein [Paracoccaceae bacterium]|uniref:ABC transporter ATP-binding protein n=1 Tax=Sulfitobacter pontiacus TaxID=60137 RepID=UPI0032902CE9